MLHCEYTFRVPDSKLTGIHFLSSVVIFINIAYLLLLFLFACKFRFYLFHLFLFEYVKLYMVQKPNLDKKLSKEVLFHAYPFNPGLTYPP